MGRISWELYKQLRFDQENKCDKHKAKTVLGNRKILLDLKIQMDHCIETWKLDVDILNWDE